MIGVWNEAHQPKRRINDPDGVIDGSAKPLAVQHARDWTDAQKIKHEDGD
jgi:hypothetical protein